MWKQPMFPSAVKWTKKLLHSHNTHTHTDTHRHTQKYYLAIKKDEKVSIFSNKDGLEVHCAKWNNQRQILNDITYMCNPKKKKNQETLV